MKKALIFGITGQDGSYLAEWLLNRGYEVTGVTRRVSVNTTERISHILPKVNIVEGDITDAFNVMKIIEDAQPDEIYNLAAQSHVGTSFSQPSLTWDVTAGGVLNILEAIRHNDRCFDIRFYQASTSELFGKNYDEELVPLTSAERKVILNPEHNIHQSECSDLPKCRKVKYQDENTKFMPQSPYAVAKMAAHNMVRIYREGYGMHTSSGILFNHESERRGEQFVTRKITKWIGKFIAFKESLRREYNLKIFKTEFAEDKIIFKCGVTDKVLSSYPKLRLGNLDASRDWGHAQDYVRAMWMMLQRSDPDDYVIATGEAHTIREFLDASFSRVDIMDWNDYVFIDPEFYRPAEVDYLRGDRTKATKVLGWKPEISFEQLAFKMVDHDVQTQRLQRSDIQKIPANSVKAGQVHMSDVQKERQKGMAECPPHTEMEFG